MTDVEKVEVKDYFQDSKWSQLEKSTNDEIGNFLRGELLRYYNMNHGSPIGNRIGATLDEYDKTKSVENLYKAITSYADNDESFLPYPEEMLRAALKKADELLKA